ncbi:MAG: DUF968 domain-containing protein [Oricola sp.]|jgi:hypothetical protein|nr:DUF968 domain-containing protein [Oricola sp.]
MAARLKSDAPAFMLPKAPPKRKVERRMRDKDYLSFLHRLPCCVSGAYGDVIAHHITMGRGRMGVKEDDSLALPLSNTLHDQHSNALHVVSERVFWTRWAINPFDLCRDLCDLYEQQGPNVPAAVALLHGHRLVAQKRLEAGLKLFPGKDQG